MIDNAKALLFEKQAQIAKALAHPLRMAVIDFLRDGERCVCDIAEHLGAERSNVSRHLSIMVRAGVLSCRKDGLKGMEAELYSREYQIPDHLFILFI